MSNELYKMVEVLKLTQGATYINVSGSVIVIDGPWIPGPAARVRTLGCIYEAHVLDSLFGDTHYLVTEQSMAEAGYAVIPDE